MINFWEYMAQDEKKDPMKVLYIGGLSTGGSRQNLLRSVGFEVIAPEFPDKVLTAVTAKMGSGEGFLSGMVQKMGGWKVQKYWNQLMGLADAATVGFEPDLIIGTSQGGAIAMETIKKHPKAKLILMAPAWRIYGVPPVVKPSTIIIHGKKDKIVPYADSVELSKENGCELYSTNDGHKLTMGTTIMLTEARRIAKELGKLPQKTVSAPQQKTLPGMEPSQLPRPGSQAWKYYSG
jgi:predicted esterase